MKNEVWCFFLIPVFCFATGAALYVRNESAVQARFERAREQWRAGENEKAVELYLDLQRKHPRSRYAARALWEAAAIYYYRLYDLSKAIYYFEELISSYPRSEYAVECRFKLAEIYERELYDPARALEHLVAVRLSLSAADRDDEIQFRIADAYFRMGNFETAVRHFKDVIRESDDPHLAQKALLRLGTVMQIQKRYVDSIEYFQRVLEVTDCGDCSLQARMGLIESLEHEDRIDEAIRLAEQLDGSGPESEELRGILLQRLKEKRKHYEPTLWSRR